MLAYTLQYAASLVPEIADSVDDVDQAMKLGYNWTAGPFELIDTIGAANVAGLIRAEKLPVPPLLAKPLPFYRVDGGFIRQRNPAGEWVKIARRPGVLLLGDIKRARSRWRRTARRACGTSATACCASNSIRA